ncbi:tetratricopeptide repeat protein [Pedobacter sp. 22226]|uniref:tetratricopeptide repeat protein n=1 Tax=Pedobacter sp. 22226 TaxID=3453894 RepID=UPI003F851FD3
MGFFDFLKKKNKGIDETKFHSKQFQNEVYALAMWKLEENIHNPELAKNELRKIGLSEDQVLIIFEKADSFLKKKKAIYSDGIDEQKFNNESYQTEILAYAEEIYFKNQHNYHVVYNHLLKKQLNDYQANQIIIKLKKQLELMVDAFQEQLDTGAISEIKIVPNPEHSKGKVDAEQVDRYIAYGAFQMERDDLENALELFNKALELDENSTLAYANKGTLYYKKEDYAKALEFYNKALTIEPNHLKILESKMDLLYDMLNEINETDFIDTVKLILKNDPKSPNALIYMVQIYLKANDLDNALKSLQVLFEDYFRENVVIQLTLDVFARLPKDKALSEFEHIKFQINVNARYQLDYCKGLHLKGIGSYDEAITVFEELNKLHDFSWNYYQIGIIKNSQGKTEECLSFLKNALRLEPELKDDMKQYPEIQNLWTDPQFLLITK